MFYTPRSPLVSAKRAMTQTEVNTQGGHVTAELGDYIVTDSCGNHFVMKPTDFRKYYKEVM